ncbi:hypothetical protein CLOHYLEM_04873 [[Clostridium] hylemonae DSM 15053]|uniref:Uncharacterized protein n=1 Tax=[Clostridium] hylemonae DSM 15053 TaxID=553973 RepID=C0BYI4_9FIRM|nr:hypothetical protein CLOHYLEM_04873 [[Clostridium] hylemonae DSM 15053]
MFFLFQRAVLTTGCSFLSLVIFFSQPYYNTERFAHSVLQIFF